MRWSMPKRKNGCSAREVCPVDPSQYPLLIIHHSYSADSTIRVPLASPNIKFAYTYISHRSGALKYSPHSMLSIPTWSTALAISFHLLGRQLFRRYSLAAKTPPCNGLISVSWCRLQALPRLYRKHYIAVVPLQPWCPCARYTSSLTVTHNTNVNQPTSTPAIQRVNKPQTQNLQTSQFLKRISAFQHPTSSTLHTGGTFTV